MNLTERAELILDIAKRIQAEKAAGRSVDPSRLKWADAIIKGNRALPPAKPSRACAPFPPGGAS